MSKPLPPGLRDASGGLWIDGRRIATVTPVEAAQTAPTGLNGLRERLEAAVARALDLLDAIDAESEDLEGHDDREPDVDDEPSLGAAEPTVDRVAFPWGGEIFEKRFDPLDQSRWGAGDCHDLEDQCDDEGGACEDEGCDSDREPDESDGNFGEYVMDQRLRPGSIAWERALAREAVDEPA